MKELISKAATALVVRYMDLRALRRMLYREMAGNYWELSQLRIRLMNVPPKQRLINDGPKDVLKFEAFEYAKIKRDVLARLNEVEDIETIYELFHRAEELSSQDQRTVFDLNPVLLAFEGRVGKAFSARTLRVVSTPLVRESIERIISSRRASGPQGMC